MEEELNYLNYTLDKFDEIIEDSNLKLNNLKKLYPNDYDAMMEEKYRLKNEINSINKSKSNPYFARIDFESDKSSEKCYIGKLGVQDYEIYDIILTGKYLPSIVDNNLTEITLNSPIGKAVYLKEIGKEIHTKINNNEVKILIEKRIDDE